MIAGYERVEELNRTVESALERLEQDMLAGHSEVFLEALAWWSRMHRFSFNNSLLIQIACPHASFVAGYRQLQAMGWQVRKGETAIAIRGPRLKKEVDQTTGEIDHKLIGYIALNVFDISQTVEWHEGKRPPEPLTPATGADWLHLYECWSRRLQTTYQIGVTEQDLGTAYGMASPQRIRINSRLDIATKATTLLHEACHIFARHHDAKDKSLQQRELEAEATTAVLCNMLGASHPAAIDYLTNYRIQPDQLKANLEVIGKLVKEVRSVLSVGFEPQAEESDLAA